MDHDDDLSPETKDKLDQVERIVSAAMDELRETVGEANVDILCLRMITESIGLLMELKCTKHAASIWMSACMQLILNLDTDDCEELGIVDTSDTPFDTDSPPDISRQH